MRDARAVTMTSHWRTTESFECYRFVYSANWGDYRALTLIVIVYKNR